MSGLPFGMRDDRAGKRREAAPVPSEFLNRLRKKEAAAAAATATAATSISAATTAAPVGASNTASSAAATAAATTTTTTTTTTAAAATAPTVRQQQPQMQTSTPLAASNVNVTASTVPAAANSSAGPSAAAASAAFLAGGRSSFAESFSSLRSSEFFTAPAAAAAPATTVAGPSSSANGGAATTAIAPGSVMLPGRNSNAVLVNKSQHNNPVLKFVRNVPYEICDDLVCDYQLGASTCAIFLSLNFHKRYPEYIHGRIRELGRQYRLRLLLVLSDLADNQACLLELTKLAVLFDLTMLVCWSNAEVGRYLESFKILEHKSADTLQERKTDDYLSMVTSCLTSIRPVNKSDSVTLLSTFSSLRGIIEADPDELRLLPGFGELKAESLTAVLNEPFVKPGRRKPSRFRINVFAKVQRQQQEGQPPGSEKTDSAPVAASAAAAASSSGAAANKAANKAAKASPAKRAAQAATGDSGKRVNSNAAAASAGQARSNAVHGDSPSRRLVSKAGGDDEDRQGRNSNSSSSSRRRRRLNSKEEDDDEEEEKEEGEDEKDDGEDDDNWEYDELVAAEANANSILASRSLVTPSGDLGEDGFMENGE